MCTPGTGVFWRGGEEMTKDTVWNSILAEEMTDYLRLRESQGHINRKDRTVLKTVDHILVKLNISEKA